VLVIKDLLGLRAALDLKESSARLDLKAVRETTALMLRTGSQVFQEKMEDVGTKVKKDRQEFAEHQAHLEIAVELEELACQDLQEEEALSVQKENVVNLLTSNPLKIF